MTADDHAAFAALPERVTLYRGSIRARGMSWTTEIDRAKFFAEYKWNKGWGQVYSTNVRKDRIRAYFTEPGEAEAVIDPRRMRYRMVGQSVAA